MNYYSDRATWQSSEEFARHLYRELEQQRDLNNKLRGALSVSQQVIRKEISIPSNFHNYCDELKSISPNISVSAP